MSELTLALARSQQPVQQPHDLILAQQYGLTPETDFEKYMNLSASASIPMPSMPQLPTGSVYIVELLASFYGELVYLNRLNSLTGCAVDSRETIGNVSKLFDDINAGAGMETYASDGMQIGFSVLQTVGDCQGASWAEVSALNTWFVTKAGSKQAMVDAATANVMLHSQEIQRHVMEVWATFFKFDQPKKTGVALGKVAYWALGPVNPDVIL